MSAIVRETAFCVFVVFVVSSDFNASFSSTVRIFVILVSGFTWITVSLPSASLIVTVESFSEIAVTVPITSGLESIFPPCLPPVDFVDFCFSRF